MMSGLPIRLLKKSLPLILFGLVGTLIYSNTFDNSYIFDDLAGIVQNNAIKDIANIQAILAYCPYRFLGFYTFALNYHFHQLDVFGYHLVNLLVHLTNTVLVWRLVTLLFQTPRMQKRNKGREEEALVVSFCAALIFLTHPIQTQAVTYIYQRLASLATLFYLASVYFYIRGRLGSQKRTIFFACAAILGALGMMTKEILFTLPFIIVLIEYYFFPTLAKKPITTKTLKLSLPVLLFTLIIPFLHRFQLDDIFGTKIQPSNDHALVTGGHYLLTQFPAVVTYIKLLFFPLGQNFDHDFPLFDNFLEPAVFLSFFLLFTILLSAPRLSKKYPLLAFGVFWFFITLLVESSIIPISDVFLEHRLYLPMFGFSLALCSSLHHLVKDLKRVFMIVGVISLVLSILTYQRNEVWQDPVTLWSDVVKKSSYRARAYDNLAEAYIDADNFDKALPLLQKAIRLDPYNAASYNNLGLIYLETENFDLAIAQFNKALVLQPQFAAAYNNLGFIFFRKGDLDAAKKYFALSIQYNSNLTNPYLNLAEIYRRERKSEESMKLYERLIRLDPSQKDSLFALAEIYFEQKNSSRAIVIGREILRRVNDPATLLDAGGLFAMNNLTPVALGLYQKALRLDPKNKKAYLELGKFYGNQGYLRQAIGIWEEGSRLDPQDQEFPKHIRMAKDLIDKNH